LACAADKLYVAPKSGGVGSIGVYALHMDYSAALEKAGIKPTFMEAGKGKTEGHPYKPLSDSAQAKIQADVDRLYGLFVDHVAKQRGMDAGAIRRFGAGLFNGAEAALTAGLADKAGAFGDALVALRQKIGVKSQTNLAGFAQDGGVDTVADASATNPEKEDIDTMPPEETQADAQLTVAAEAETASETVAETAATVTRDAEIARAASTDAAEITALCALAGLPASRAHAYISAKKSPQEVRDELLSARAAEAEKAEIVSQTLPQTGTTGESPLLKAAEKTAADYAAAKGAH
jgi:ClpP class serine protease